MNHIKPYKINQDYLDILKEYLDKINFFNSQIPNNKTFIKDLSWYLRNLYCDKSWTKSFLYRVCNRYNIQILVKNQISLEQKIERGLLNKEEAQLLKWLEEGILLSHNSSAFFWFNDNKSSYYDYIDLLSVIEYPWEIFINWMYYSYKQWIEIVADKFDAHIDDKINEKDFNYLESLWIMIWWFTWPEKIIFDLTEATIKLLDIIINYIENWITTNYIKEIWKQ